MEAGLQGTPTVSLRSGCFIFADGHKNTGWKGAQSSIPSKHLTGFNQVLAACTPERRVLLYPVLEKCSHSGGSTPQNIGNIAMNGKAFGRI